MSPSSYTSNKLDCNYVTYLFSYFLTASSQRKPGRRKLSFFQAALWKGAPERTKEPAQEATSGLLRSSSSGYKRLNPCSIAISYNISIDTSAVRISLKTLSCAYKTVVSLLVLASEMEVLRCKGDQMCLSDSISHKYGWMLCSCCPCVTTLVTH